MENVSCFFISKILNEKLNFSKKIKSKLSGNLQKNFAETFASCSSNLSVNIALKYCNVLSIFSSHRKNCFAARCEYLHLIKKNLHEANRHCEFFLIRCKHTQRAANQFLRWLEKRFNTQKYPVFVMRSLYLQIITN